MDAVPTQVAVAAALSLRDLHATPAGDEGDDGDSSKVGLDPSPHPPPSPPPLLDLSAPPSHLDLSILLLWI
jgi:hypothetical protein